MKRILQTGITGQQGVALVESVVLKMGSIWHPTGGLEAGTDGYIEFRDPATGEMLNLHLPVQSKATTTRFSSETATQAAYVCTPDDLEYWLKGNKPIVLVVSRPTTGEAYWVSVKDYFRDPALRRSRRIVFNKDRDRFDESSLPRLISVATSNAGGGYLAPRRKPERIISSLQRVTRLPQRLFHGYTDCANGKEVRRRLIEAGDATSQEWAYRGKQIISVHDLSVGAWKRVCDPGTVEDFGAEEWANSYDEDRRNDFVDLLRQCLRSRLQRMHVRFEPDEKYYHFTATHDLAPRIVTYRSLARDSERPVFKEYTKTVEGVVWTYYRHNGFYGRFRRYSDEWFLQIDPTYRFTSDGRSEHPRASALLSGIRKLEKNPAVLGQVVMWAALLRDTDTQDMFGDPPYPYLGFEDLLTFESAVGIDDDEWLTSDDDPEALKAKEQVERAELDFLDVLDAADGEDEA
jgi:hypothetical protein